MQPYPLPKPADPPEVHEAYRNERIARGDPSYVIHPDEVEIRPCTPRRHGELFIPRAHLAALPAYSCSLPTGTYVWKRWRASTTAHTPRFVRERQEWLVAQYVPHPNSHEVGILWWWALDENREPHRGDLR